MSGIIAKYGTPKPVAFKEKGCDTEFSARVSGALYIDFYNEAAFGADESERRSKLGMFAVEKVTEHLSHWHEEDRILRVHGVDVLEAMLTEDMKAAGMMGAAKVNDIRIIDEMNDLYQEQIMEPYNKAQNDQFQAKLEAADEPHGPLREFSYSLSTHGMMAGSSSGSSRSVKWNNDGSVIYRSSSHGGGCRTEREFKVTPETAKKISDFVVEKRLAALSKMDIPTAVMFDNFTSAAINMTFDDSSLGGDAYNHFFLNCGPASYTFKSLEDMVVELLKECEETGECIKNDFQKTDDPTANLFGMMGMGMTPLATAGPDLDGMKQMQERMLKAATESAATAGTKWTCKCGSENTGKFCPECGEPRV